MEDKDRAEAEQLRQRLKEIEARLESAKPVTYSLIDDAKALKADADALEERLMAKERTIKDDLAQLGATEA